MRFAGEEHAERPPVGGVVLTKITLEYEYYSRVPTSRVHRSQIFPSQSSFAPFSRLDADIFRLVLDLSDIGLHSFQTALQMHISFEHQRLSRPELIGARHSLR
jgi:hypothetical protein